MRNSWELGVRGCIDWETTYEIVVSETVHIRVDVCAIYDINLGETGRRKWLVRVLHVELLRLLRLPTLLELMGVLSVARLAGNIEIITGHGGGVSTTVKYKKLT